MRVRATRKRDCKTVQGLMVEWHISNSKPYIEMANGDWRARQSSTEDARSMRCCKFERDDSGGKCQKETNQNR
jgi:hypothetical protein